MHRSLIVSAIVMVGSVATPVSRAGDWPQILGPARSGRAADDERLPATLPAAGPRASWRRPVGSGYAGVAVAGGRVFLFHRVDDVERLEALEAATGRTLWTLDQPTTFAPQVGGNRGPLCVPVVAGDRVVTFGAQGMLTCAATDSGRRLWQRDTHREYGAQEGYFGAGSTPLVSGDRVIANVGGSRREAGIVAFALADGTTLWTKTAEPASYSAPVAVIVGGRPHVLMLTRYQCLLLDPADGTVGWQFPFGQRGPTVNAAAPVTLPDGALVVTASYGIGSVCAAFDERGTTRRWEGVESLATQYCTPIAHGEHLYGFDGREDGPPGALVCLEARSGRRAWEIPALGYGHVIAAGDRLLAVKTDGEIVLLAADPRQPTLLGRARPLTGAVRAAPALAGGLLFLRDDTTLVALQVNTD